MRRGTPHFNADKGFTDLEKGFGGGLGSERLDDPTNPEYPIPNPYKWLIKLAILPAPKPLSMFTTDTPEAQLFSIARSAVIPPKLAP